MPRIGIVADVHVHNHARFGGVVVAGVNDRAHAVLRALARAVEAAQRHGCDELIIAGDLFDTSAPTPQLIAAVEKSFGDELPIRIIRGNHDMVSDVVGDHALGPLAHLGGVFVHEAPAVFTPATNAKAPEEGPAFCSLEVVLVPFRPGDARVWLPAAMKEVPPRAPTAKRRVLVSHVGVIVDDTPAFLQKAHDAVELSSLLAIADAHGIDDVWLGNWHEHRVWMGGRRGARVGQVGALAPTGFDNPGREGYGKLIVLDHTGKLDVVTIPGPRFVDLDMRRAVVDQLDPRDTNFVRVRVEPKDADHARKCAAEWLEKKLVVGAAVEVVDDPLDLEVAADGVAEARRASTLEEALGAFIDPMQLEEGVDREDVRARAGRYLANVPGSGDHAGSPGDVLALDVRGFATHVGGTQLDLPARGVVAITGANGAGKSTLLDAVAVALWGETLRGDALWRTGEPGQVGLSTSAVEVVRERSKGGKGSLSWGAAVETEVALPVYENATKAQAALEARVGSFTAWRRTSVFSSVDSDTFTRASDAERKRLLETFLGLDRFDAALKACRGDLKLAVGSHSAACIEETRANTLALAAGQQVEHARQELAAATEAAGPVDLATAQAEVEKWSGRLAMVRRDRVKAEERRGDLDRQLAAVGTRGMDAEARLRKVEARTGTCPTCGGAIDTAKHAAEVEQLRAALADLNAQKAALLAQRTDIAGDVTELRDVEAGIEKKHAAARDTAARAEAHAGAKGRAEAALEAAEERQEAAAAKAHTARKAVAAAKVVQDTLAAVEGILGTRGVRALVLTRALASLEQGANRWLRRFPTEDGPMRVKVAGTTERANGDAADVISIRVAKARAPDVWRSYLSCSGGERRRLDLAFLFALRELAIASTGAGAGTLWCDEVFDALDAQGAQDVSSALAELARDRAVVVITHNPDLLAHLRPTMHLHVGTEKGAARLEVRRPA
jgi:ABC-type lipoprotein export system ATPase subunit